MSSKNKVLVATLLLLVLGTSLMAAPRRGRTGFFQNGATILTPELVVVSHSTWLGANLEHGFGPNLGIGGDVAFSLEGEGALLVSPDVAYHFNLTVRELDVFVGAGLYMAFGFGGGSDIGFKPFSGLRLTLSPNLAGYVKLFVAIAEGSSFGAAFGVSLKI